MDMDLPAYLHTDVPGAESPSVERVEVINFLGDGYFTVRTSYGVITASGDRLTPAITLRQYVEGRL